MLTRIRCIAASILLALAFGSLAFGQATEGTILGTVTDTSNAVVPNASVSVTNNGTGIVWKTTTDTSGEYAVVNLPVGNYKVEVEAPGFKKGVQASVQLQIKYRFRVNFRLEVGATTQTIQVKGTAPLLQTDSPEVGGVVSRQLLSDLPVLSRNYLTVATLLPGTTAGSARDRRRDLNGAAVTVDGTTSESNNFLIDGVANNEEFVGAMGVVPAIDSIQEFKVQTENYSAEFGRSGGGVINVAMKTGTNSLHGTAYDYLQNDVLNARSFFDVKKLPLRRNQFGFTLGGPIKKNRAFFFGNYEGVRASQFGQTFAHVPTAAQKQGDFTNSYQVYDPNSDHPDPNNPSQIIRDPFVPNIVPSNLFDPVGVAFLSLYPDPNYSSPATTANYLAATPSLEHQNAFNVKVDVLAKQADTVSARYTQQRGGLTNNGWMPNNVIGGTARANATNAGLVYTHTFSPRLLNEFRWGYNSSLYGNAMGYTKDILGPFNIVGVMVDPDAIGAPQIAPRNLSGVSPIRILSSLPNPFLLKEAEMQFLDSLSYVRGAHTLKWGGGLEVMRDDRSQPFPGGGYFGFAGQYSSAAVNTYSPDSTADMLMGLASRAIAVNTRGPVNLRSKRGNLYLQDYWRATRKLTLSLGVRYSVNGQWRERDGYFSNFDLNNGTVLLPEVSKAGTESFLGGALPSKYQYVPESQVIPHTNWHDIAPRFGLAYAVTDRVVARAGYGVFYSITVANNLSNGGLVTPWRLNNDIVPDKVTPWRFSDGFPGGGLLGTASGPNVAPYYAPLHWRTPYVQKWNGDLQISLGPRNLVDVGYVGQHALSFPFLSYFNVPTPGPGPVVSRRPFADWAPVLGYMPINDSNYNALEISFKMEASHGLTLQSSFTYGRAYAYASGTDGGIITDPYDIRYDWGRADYDARRRWVSAFIYTIPTPGNLPSVGRQVLRNWLVSGILTLQSGMPFTVTLGQDVLNNGLGRNRPDISTDPSLPGGQRTLMEWFNTAAFSKPALYTYGNEPKNPLEGPGLAVLDFATQKTIPFGEARRLIFRMEMANLFNRANFGFPNSTYLGNDFGIIRSAGPGRTMQAVLRFEF